MRFSFGPLGLADAEAIASWRYPSPYDFYDLGPEDDPALLALSAARFFAARDEAGALVGYACFGEAAQVPGGVAGGHYRDDLLDVGLGLRPDLTGRGIGGELVRAILALGRARYRPTGFRLTVAAFNLRAIKVYERAGFQLGPGFDNRERGLPVPFRLMTRPESGLRDLPGEQEEAAGEDEHPTGP
jgi:ribosomal-protein-alanine N-acetyltransferase